MALKLKDKEKIVNTYYDRIYKFCVSRCGSSGDAQDITQDVFLLFMKKADNLNVINSGAWLYSVANLKVKEYYKKKQKDCCFIPYEECENILCDYPEDDPCTVDDFEKLLTDTQKRIFSILTEKEKEIFIKRFIEKKSIQIIAEELDITENNASVQVHRVKKKARKVITTTELIINIIIVKIF